METIFKKIKLGFSKEGKPFLKKNSQRIWILSSSYPHFQIENAIKGVLGSTLTRKHCITKCVSCKYISFKLGW